MDIERITRRASQLLANVKELCESSTPVATVLTGCLEDLNKQTAEVERLTEEPGLALIPFGLENLDNLLDQLDSQKMALRRLQNAAAPTVFRKVTFRAMEENNAYNWFLQLEVQFQAMGIQSDAERFGNLLALLSPSQASVVHTVTIQESGQRYQRAKELLIENFSLSRFERYEKLFHGMKKGSDKPSQYLTRVLSLMGDDTDKDSIAQWLVLRELPEDVRSLLATKKDIFCVSELVLEADRIMASRPSEVTTAATFGRKPGGISSSHGNSKNKRQWPPKKLCELHAKFGERSTKCLGTPQNPCPMFRWQLHGTPRNSSVNAALPGSGEISSGDPSGSPATVVAGNRPPAGNAPALQ